MSLLRQDVLASYPDIDPARVIKKGRLRPGRMFLIDTSQGRIIDDEEIKAQLAAEHPYGDWLDEGLKHLDGLPEVFHITESSRDVLREQQTFGYTHEEIKILIEPMARAGIEVFDDSDRVVDEILHGVRRFRYIGRLNTAIVIGDGPEPCSIDVGTTHHVPHRRRLTGTAHVHDGLALAPLIPGQLDPIHRDHRHVDPLLSHPENAR